MTLNEAISWMKQPGIKAVTEGMDRHTSEAINTLINASEELEVYMNALDLLSMRTNVLDRTINIDCVWSAKRWKDWAIDSAKKSMEVSLKERKEI